MRALAGIAVATLLVLATMPADAKPDHPFPKTENATRKLVRDTLADVDNTGEKLAKAAHRLIRTAGGALGATNGELEIRAVLTQPGIQGQDETLAVLWIGAKEGHWTGAYWVEATTGGNTYPTLLDIDQTGILLFLHGGSETTSDTVTATYHFLGIEGEHSRRTLRDIPLLPEVPTLQRVDVGGAIATREGIQPPAIFVTPWNLYDTPKHVGLTLRAHDAELQTWHVESCTDPDQHQMEPGCRLLYILPLPSGLTHLDVWTFDEQGERQLERTLTRAQLERGTRFAP